MKKEPTLSSVVIPQLKLILENLLLMIPYLNNNMRVKRKKLKDMKKLMLHDEPEDTSVLHPPSPKSVQLQELMDQEDLIHKLNKKTREKIVPYPRFLSLLLEHMIPEYENEELTINPAQAICNLDVPLDSKASKPSSQTEEVPQGKKPGAKSIIKRKRSSKHIFESTIKASKSQTGQSKKETKTSSNKDKSPSHPSLPTLVVGEMHKKAQQSVGGLTSLGATCKEGAHPHLSSDKTKSAGDWLRTAHTNSGANKESRADDISLKVKLEDLSDILKDTRSAFFTQDSPPDEPIIVTDESEEEVAKDKDTKSASYDSQKKELEQAKAKAEAEVASMKAKPSYPNINQLTELLIIRWELPTEFLNFPSQVSSVQEKLKIFDSLLSLLHKVTHTLNMFATMVENSSGATSMNVPSAGKATASPVEGEKNTKDADTNLKDELVDLLCKNIMTQYYTKKLLFDKHCDKMLKRKKSPQMRKCEDLTKKGPITLKIYREDGSDEVISDLKVSDLHLEE
nr:hypothetical protein [Tanacetum cinerariifolium]